MFTSCTNLLNHSNNDVLKKVILEDGVVAHVLDSVKVYSIKSVSGLFLDHDVKNCILMLDVRFLSKFVLSETTAGEIQFVREQFE